MAVFRIEKNKDYTVMSNHHLRDRELTLRSKGLLSLMLSLPDEWDYSMKGLAHICKEGIDAIRASLTELEKNGYIERRRVRNDKGLFSDVEYLIHEKPIPMNPQSGYPRLENPTLDNPTLDKPISDEPTLVNPTQLNKDKTITDSENKECMKYPSINQSEPYGFTDGKRWMDRYEQNIALVKKNIEYDALVATNDEAVISNIVEVMAEVLTEDIPYYTIEGKQVSGEIVRRRFLSIDQMMLDSFMIGFNRITKKIYNPKSFLITSLFNIPATVGTDLANMVRNDQYERDGR